EDAIKRYPRHLFLTMELSTVCFRAGNIKRAEELLAEVRHEFLEERRALAPLQKEISAAVRDSLLEKKMEQDIYTKEFVIDTWWYYLRSYLIFNAFQDGNVALDHGIRREIAKFLIEVGA